MYGKLFEQIYDGSLRASGPWQALVTFQQLIILSNRHGEVDMTPVAIAARTGIPLEVFEIGLHALEQPDPESRSPAEEGRRIVRLCDSRPWGWRIVNYEHYRRLQTAEERREYHRLYGRERRSNGVNSESVDIVDSQHASTKSTNSSKQYAVSSKHKRTNGQKPKATEKPSPFAKSVCDALYETWISARGVIQYSAFRKALLPLYPASGPPRFTQEQLTEAIKVYAEWVEGLPPRDAGFETVYRFVGDIARWVKLGAMPAIDPGTRMPTERGQLA